MSGLKMRFNLNNLGAGRIEGIALIFLLNSLSIAVLPASAAETKPTEPAAAPGLLHLATPDGLEIIWNRGGQTQTLKSWTLKELGSLKRAKSKERDPSSGKTVEWQGVLLSTLVDQALAKLPADNRAHIDLVVLKNSKGEQAPIPRFLMMRYPLLLALLSSEVQGENNKRGPIYSIMPWSSKPAILKEILPVEKYFLAQVSQIELANDHERHEKLLLKRRTDPSAIRGEKMFVQSCSMCHNLDQRFQLGAWEENVRDDAKPLLQHAFMKVSFNLTQKDWRSIIRYLQAYHSEHPLQGVYPLASSP